MSFELLREYIQMVTINQIPAGAGVVVVRSFPNGLRVLALQNHDGTLDIPKGAIDENEFPLEAALRECEEEASITQLDFRWGLVHIVNSELTCYVAYTDQEAKIKRNPHTGIIEHSAAHWVDWNSILSNTENYLIPCLLWAKGVIENGKNP